MRIKRGFDYRILFTVVYVAAGFYCFMLGLRPAGATRHENNSYLGIPSISLMSSVESMELSDNRLHTPDMVAGSFNYNNSNRTLLVGHSSTVFDSLSKVRLGEKVFFDGSVYKIHTMEVLEKSAINMNQLVKDDGSDIQKLIIMTCAGELYENGDASHRLIIIASKIN